MSAKWICQIVLFVIAHVVGPLEEPAAKSWPVPADLRAVANRDKTGTTTRQEKTEGSQVLWGAALTSPTSFPAERTGFEPADQLPGHGFSKPALSTTQPPLRIGHPGSRLDRRCRRSRDFRQFGQYRKAAMVGPGHSDTTRPTGRRKHRPRGRMVSAGRQPPKSTSKLWLSGIIVTWVRRRTPTSSVDLVGAGSFASTTSWQAAGRKKQKSASRQGV